MAEDRYLPGTPKKKLVGDVRRQLASYGIRPSLHRQWHETWQWASRIKSSYAFPGRWPLPVEIAAQYVYLLLVEMNTFNHLKLPYRCGAHVPESVKVRLPNKQSPPLLEFNEGVS